MALGELLAQARAQKQWTRDKAGRLIGLSEREIAEIEDGSFCARFPTKSEWMRTKLLIYAKKVGLDGNQAESLVELALELPNKKAREMLPTFKLRIIRG